MLQSVSTPKVLLHLLTGFVLFMVSAMPSDLIALLNLDSPTVNIMLKSVIDIAVFLLLFHLYITKVLKRDFQSYGIVKPQFSLFWLGMALALPVGVICFYLLSANGVIEFCGYDKLPASIARLIRTGFVAGITEELLFRGFIMKTVEERWNKKTAIIAPSVLFALVHILKGMGSVDTLLLVVAGTSVGIMFSLVTYCSKSLWNAAAFHVVWNALIIRFFYITADPDFSMGIFNFHFQSRNPLLTGGEFGVEAGIPAIIAYGIVIAIALVKEKKHDVSKN